MNKEITTEQKPKFSSWVREITPGQTFGDPTFVKHDKEIHVHDFIQEGREDTEIYPTLEKYGSLKKLETNAELVFGDATEIKDLRGAMKVIENGKKRWNAMSLEDKAIFGNDPERFINEGENWIKTKIAEIQKLEQDQNIKDTNE